MMFLLVDKTENRCDSGAFKIGLFQGLNKGEKMKASL